MHNTYKYCAALPLLEKHRVVPTDEVSNRLCQQLLIYLKPLFEDGVL